METERQPECAIELFHFLTTEHTDPRLEACLVDRREVVGVAPARLGKSNSSDSNG